MVGDRQYPIHIAKNWLLDQFTIDDDQPRVGLLEGSDDSARALDLIGVRYEHRVDGGDLFGMNRPFAGEPEVACLPCGSLGSGSCFALPSASMQSSTMRRALHDGQKLRHLQLKASRCSWQH